MRGFIVCPSNVSILPTPASFARSHPGSIGHSPVASAAPRGAWNGDCLGEAVTPPQKISVPGATHECAGRSRWLLGADWSRRRPRDAPHRWRLSSGGGRPGQDPMTRTSNSLTTLGLARPRVSRITCPTSAPSTPDLPPRNLATRSGLAAITLATASSSAPVSEIWARPLRRTIVLGLTSVVNISLRTSLAAVADSVSAWTRSTSSPSRSAETGLPAMVSSCSRRPRCNSPMTHPATTLGSRPLAGCRGQPGAPLGRQLGKGGTQAIHPLGRRLDRNQIRLREVAIVHRVLLGAHRLGAAGGLVPVPRLLDEPAALGERAALPLGLVADRPVQAAQRVEVLQLDLGAELGMPERPDRHVHVEAHRALFELDVRDPERQQHRPQLLGVGTGLLGGAHVRLGDDLDQRDAGAVVVDQRVVGAVDAAGGAHVQRLAGVLFEMDPGDPEAPHLALHRHVQVPADAQRLVVLADLIVLRHVRIEVVLAVELRPLGDAAVQREPDPGRVLDRGAV